MTSKLHFPRFLTLFAMTLLWSGTVLADSWTLVPEESEIRFRGNQTGNPFEGIFETFTVQIQYDPDQPAAAYVHAAIDTGSAKTGDTQRDEALPGKDWFFSSMFPSATFEANGFTPTGSGQFSTSGTLNIKGIEKDFTLPFTLSIDGSRAVMNADVPLNRQDFDIGAGPWTEGKWVGLDVIVSIKITAIRERS